MQKLRQKVFLPVDAITAEIFLRLFGIVIILQVASYMSSGFIEKGILAPKFLFTYDFFHWIKPMSAGTMGILPALLAICGILIAIGKFRKPALAVFCIVFTYMLLLEKSYYNNHFYFMSLLSFLFLFYSPQKGEGGKLYIPYWFLLLVQVQVVIVYFYGGLAKLSYDWLVRMEPIHSFLDGSSKKSAMPFLNSSDFGLYLLTYGGLLFDLSIGFLLWMKRTRKAAIILCLVFNALNFLLFNFGSGGDIGIFPFMMICTCVLFIDPKRMRERLSKIIPSLKKQTGKKKKEPAVAVPVLQNTNKKLITALFFFYIGVQLLLPLRHWLYPGNTSWTFKGGRFAWRLKVHQKVSKIQYYFQLTPADTLRPADIGMIINTMQQSVMGEDPSMLLQLADYMGKDLKKAGYPDAAIKVSAKVSLNGRPYRFVVDSTQNLLALKHQPFKSDDWILPLENSQ